MCLCSCLARAAVKIDQRMSHHVLINLIFSRNYAETNTNLIFSLTDGWENEKPRDVRFLRKSRREWLLNAGGLSRRHRAGLLSGKAIDSRLRNSQKKIDVKTIKTRSSHFYESNFMFFVRFIQQVLHSLRDSDAMIRKARSFPTLSSVNGSIQWPNRVWLSWSQPAPIVKRTCKSSHFYFTF